jgi:hypothetical protein
MLVNMWGKFIFHINIFRPLDSVLNYPLFYKLRDVFTWHLDMNELKYYYDDWI